MLKRNTGRIKILLCVLLLSFSSTISFAQTSTAAASSVKAVFLYNFSRFIEWPASANGSNDSPFIIGVIGGNPFGTSLEEAVSGESVGSHPIQIHYYNNVSEITNCHILYINNNDPYATQEIVTAIAGKNILTVSDQREFLKQGGIVRFFTESSKIRFQVNLNAAKTSQLNISSKLLSVAMIY